MVVFDDDHGCPIILGDKVDWVGMRASVAFSCLCDCSLVIRAYDFNFCLCWVGSP